MQTGTVEIFLSVLEKRGRLRRRRLPANHRHAGGGVLRMRAQSGADFDAIARHLPALRLVFARFDPRQIGPRLPATAGATAAPARQARPDLPTIGVRRIPCLPPCGVNQSGRAFPHRGTATPTLGPVSPCQFRQAVLRQTRTRPMPLPRRRRLIAHAPVLPGRQPLLLLSIDLSVRLWHPYGFSKGNCR